MEWSRCADLPVATSAPQLVQLGDHVYVGGGYRNPGACKNIFRYDLKTGAWSHLPRCPTYQHGLATLGGELLAIGGTLASPSGKHTNKVFSFREGGGEEGGIWREVLPPMPTARCLPSAASYEDRLVIVAGGVVSQRRDGKSRRTDTVEILVVQKRQWYETRPLPFPTYSLSMSVVGDRCYVLGGVGTPQQSCTTLCASLYSLMECAEPAEADYISLRPSTTTSSSSSSASNTWDTLRGPHPLPSPSLVEVDGRLVALGGEKWTPLSVTGTKFVSTYSFATDTWVECKGAELPVAVYRPGVVRLEQGRVMMVGGEVRIRELATDVFIGECLGLFQVRRHATL